MKSQPERVAVRQKGNAVLKDVFVEQARARETPQRAVIETLVSDYLGTYASGDVEARVRLFAPDGSFEDPVGSPAMVGHAALRAFFLQGVGMTMTAQLERLTVCRREAVFTFNVTLEAGEAGRVTIRPTETLEIDDQGRIAKLRAYFDVNSIG